jgi:hypothetical protein
VVHSPADVAPPGNSRCDRQRLRLVATPRIELLLVGAQAAFGIDAAWLKGRSTRMGYRIGFYALILAATLLTAMGFGLFTQVGRVGRQARSIILAAPASADNSSDNSSSDNSSSDNSSSSDNGSDNGAGTASCASTTPSFVSSLLAAPASADNSSDNSGSDNSSTSDNGSDNSCTVTKIVIVSTPTPKPTPKPAAPAAAPPAPAAPAAQGPCQFVLGFADLHRILNGRDGTCLENEHPDPNGSGDEVQATSLPSPNGLMVWNRFTNSMRWTDGFKTWTYSKCLLQERLNTETFAWERNPNLLVPESAPVPEGACDKV